MGFFGTYLFDGAGWADADPGEEPTAPPPWLWLSIHDSDIAMVMYEPSGVGSGVTFLGASPGEYFGEGAPEPPDPGREAAGLAQWWADRTPGADDGAVETRREEIRALLASAEAAGAPGDGPQAPADADPAGDEVRDDAFVEVTAARLLDVLAVPLPAELREVVDEVG